MDAEKINDILSMIDETLVLEFLETIVGLGPRVTGTYGCEKAAQYIHQEFQDMGLIARYQNWRSWGNKYHHHIYNSQNIEGTLPGTNTTDSSAIIFNAHYDSVAKGPGANDDGSGVAAVLAIAKILSQYSFNYTIRFIAFSGEDVGLYGSYMYTRDASRRGDNIVAVIQIDMIGFANTAEGRRTLCFNSPEQSKWIADFATRVDTFYRNQTNLTIEINPSIFTDDHQSFVDHGFDGLFAVHYDWPDPCIIHRTIPLIDSIGYILRKQQNSYWSLLQN